MHQIGKQTDFLYGKINRKYSRAYCRRNTLVQASNMSDTSDGKSPPKGSQAPFGHHSYANRHSISHDPTIHGAVGSKMDKYDSQLDRHELFLLEDGEKKVEFEPETRKSSYILQA